MSDIFFNEENTSKGNTENTVNTNVNQNTNQVLSMESAVDTVREQQQIRNENQKKFGFDAPDGYYELLNQLAEESKSKDVVYDDMTRLAAAQAFSDNMPNVSLDDAYVNLEKYNILIWGEDIFANNRTSNGKAIRDQFRLGMNNTKQSKLAFKLMQAETDGREEEAAALMAEIEAIDNENATLQDYNPRNKLIKGLEIVSQAAPFTFDVIAAGAVGTVSGTGAVPAFFESSRIQAGDVYLTLRRQGRSVDTSRKVSLAVGALQGIAESTVGEASNYLIKSGSKVVGNAISKAGSEKLADFLTKKFALSNGFNKAIQVATNYAIGAVGETAEEGVQELESIVGENIAAWLEGQGVPNNDAKEIAGRLKESVVGGFIGALGLGVPGLAYNGAASAVDLHRINSYAKKVPSEEMFINEMMKERTTKDGETYRVADAIVHKDDADLKQKLKDVHKVAQSAAMEEEILAAKSRAEVNPAAEGFEEVTENEETGESDLKPAYREDGKLAAQENITTDDDGTIHSSYRVGDRSQKEKNLYGYINSVIDEENKTVTIEDFAMSSDRESLRAEVFDNFADKYAGYDIQWNTKGKEAAALKEELINANPSGAQYGLNYYKVEVGTKQDIEARKNVAKQIKEAYIKANISLSSEQLATNVAILESMYKRIGRDIEGVNSFSDYINYTFGSKMFGNISDAEKAAALQGETHVVQGGSITRSIAEFNKGMKAIIYVTENGDFSTFSHEVAHVARKQLQGDLLRKAEEAFGVTDGNWTIDQEEQFAYGFEKFLRTGKAKNEGLKELFKKIAQFLNEVFNALLKNNVNITPEIESVYNELLQGDDSVLRNALRAAEENDREFARQNSLVESENIKKEMQQMEDQKIENEAAADTSIVEDEEKEINDIVPISNDSPISQEEIEALLDGVLSDEEIKQTVAETLLNPYETIETKGNVAMDAAGGVYENNVDDVGYNDSFEGMIFQSSPKDIKAAIDYVDATFTPEEAKRVKDNLTRLQYRKDGKKQTAWFQSCIYAINARHDINAILNGESISEDSVLYKEGNQTYLDVLSDGNTREERINSLFNYFECDGTFLGHASKPVNSVASSFINCNPSQECAEWCYAATGRSAFMLAVNRELVNLCVETDPIRTAEAIADDYCATGEYRKKVALRLLDTGDLSEPWVKMINKLNERGISCQVFSKRPELLRKIDPKKNVIELSIDQSNINLAMNNTDLPWAYVHSGTEESIKFLVEHKDNFTQNGGVILPVVINRKKLSREDIAKLPRWTLHYMCPIDAGWKEIGDNRARKHDPGKWNCTVCDLNGQGCFFQRAVKDREKFIQQVEELPEGVFNAFRQQFIEHTRQAMEAAGATEEQIRSVLDSLGKINNNSLGSDVRAGKEGNNLSNGQSLSTTTEEESGISEEEARSEEELRNFKFQKIVDQKEIERLNNEKTVKAYSAMQLVDGGFYPPMAKKVAGKTVEAAHEGDWFKSDEHPEIAFFYTQENPSKKFYSLEEAAGQTPKLDIHTGDIAWYFDLKKDGKDSSGKPLGTIPARYNPYWHSTKAESPLGVLNDQFSSAYKRPNIVIVEVEIPLSDLNSGYKAERAKDPVGELRWHEGPVSSKLKGTPDERTVMLSQYKKIVRALSNEEVADLAAEDLKKYDITIPDNTMTPGLIRELEKRGVKIEKTAEVAKYNQLLQELGKDPFLSQLNKNKAAYEAERKARKKNNDLKKMRFQTELDAVRQQYENTDKWMKAPNGTDTQLTEKQWLQVRTPAFKQWFGDWENDPANASKMLMLNGEPDVYLRGDNGEEVKNNISYYTEKFYEAGAASYGDVGKYYLNAKNPIDIRNRESFNAELQDFSKSKFNKNNFDSSAIDDVYLYKLLDEKQKQDFIEYEKSKGYDLVIANATDMSEEMNMPEFITTRSNQVKSATDNNGNFDVNNDSILFQTVYHGTTADFDKFNTEQYGLSGEGSMSFGYGAYVTASEEIARDYAERQFAAKYDSTTLKSQLEAAKKTLEEQKEKVGKYETAESYYGYRDSEIERLKSDIEERKVKGESTTFLENLIKGMDTVYTEENRLLYLKSIQSDITKIEKEIPEMEKTVAEMDAGIEGATRKLYTIDIPDRGFLQWDKTIPKATRIRIVDKLYSELIKGDYAGAERELRYELNPLVNTPLNGQELYQDVWTYLGSDKAASEFLNKIGYAGIEYPAGTNFGTSEENARNFVIFNDEDAKIIEKMQFQTQQELMEDARTFATWQEFMEFYEVMGKPEVTPIPYDADAQWYQSAWELAHGYKTEESENAEQVAQEKKEEGNIPDTLDAMWTAELRTNPTMVDDFIGMVAYYEGVDVEQNYADVADEQEAAERQKVEELQDYIDVVMADKNFHAAINAVRGGNSIPTSTRQKILTEMTDPAKSRNFRALYAAVMDAQNYAVDEKDSIPTQLKERFTKYEKRYYDLVKPNENFEKMSPERLKTLAAQMNNRDMAAKIRSGKLKLDNELDAYLKSLNVELKDAENKLHELEKETQNDYQRLADAEKRALLRLHEKLMIAKGKYNKSNSEITRKINKGLKITDKYYNSNQNLKANYDELYRKFSDLKEVIGIDAEIEQILQRQENVIAIKDEINTKQKEKSVVAEVKKLRIQLVKRTMRRIPFDRIDYDNAKTIIAIQRILEPNLIGGVNRFIGIDTPYVRGIISGILTDTDYKELVLSYLRNKPKKSQTYADFLNKLESMKSIKELDKWTRKDFEYAARVLPKEDWIKDLNLRELSREREESIDLNIEMIPQVKVTTDEKGKEVIKTTYTAKVAADIEQMVKDAIGVDMYNNLINVPFSEWTTSQLEELATTINNLYTEGRDLLAAKKQLKKERAAEIRSAIEKVVNNTNIVIDIDDTPEEKERKQNKINEILGINNNIAGTNAVQDKGFKAKINRLLHGYNDANVLRFARILDGNTEGVNVQQLYRKENDCYVSKQKSINDRAVRINQIMKDSKITADDLAKTVDVAGMKFTIDELLFIQAASKDAEQDQKKLDKGKVGLDANDDYAATSINAVMFGNMLSDSEALSYKQSVTEEDEAMMKKIETGNLTPDEQADLIEHNLVKKPGTAKYVEACRGRMAVALAAAEKLDPKYKALAQAIAEDYAEQYGRMNEISVKEFNSPVHRVNNYVPLVRLESNGDTNINQVKEDLLGAYGGQAGKQWVNKGMTKHRVNISPLHQKPVQMGLYKTWCDSVERTEHFIAYSAYVQELNNVYKSRDAQFTRAYIENRYGKGAIKYIDDYINEVANPRANKVREAGSELMHTLRGKTAPAYLAWKASAIIKQAATSPWPYMQFVNPAEYMASSAKIIASGGKLYDLIREKSVFMNNRVMDPMNDLIDEMAEKSNQNKFSRAINKFNAKGMAGLEWIDWVCVAPGWYACYQKEYARLNGHNQEVYENAKARMTEENMYADYGTSAYKTAEQIEQLATKEMEADVERRAVEYADDCTRQCQPSNRSVDISPLFKNSSEAMKAYLQFQTSLNVIWQNIRYDIPYAVKNKMFYRIAGTIVGYTAAGIFMNSVMEGLPDDDDDENAKLKALCYYATTQFTDSIPMIGSELTNTMDKLITGKQQFMNSGTDMTPTASKFFSILTNAKKGNWQKAAEMTVEGIGMYLGLPVSGMKEIGKLAGVGDGDGEAGLNLGEVYGIVNNFTEDK